MKIKTKILAGFLLIIIMLLIAGAMSIFEFSRIGKSVKALIDDNYITLKASKTMIEALEREDSGILLLIAGKWEKGRSILNSADSSFLLAFNLAKNNITEENEEIHIKNIKESYLKFKSIWKLPVVGTDKQNSSNWYLNDVHENFLNAKQEVEALISLNQTSMYEEASDLKNQSIRAIMPGIVAISFALIFLIIFNFFIGLILVRPINKIINSVKGYHSYSHNFSADIKNHDEFKILENEIQKLTQRLQK